MFNCHANLPLDLLFLLIYWPSLAYSGRYLYLWSLITFLCRFHSLSRYRISLDRDDAHIPCHSLLYSNCLRNAIAKCSLAALAGTLQMVYSYMQNRILFTDTFVIPLLV